MAKARNAPGRPSQAASRAMSLASPRPMPSRWRMSLHKSGNRTQNGAHGKGEKCAGEAEPGGEQGHELGVAKADALAVADEFVEPTDEQDEAAGGENADEFPKCKAVDKMLLQPLRAVFAKNGI